MHAADLLSKRAYLTPNRTALVETDTGRRYSYAELNERANCLANYFSGKLGVEKGVRVSILAQNCMAYVDLLYGLPKIGAIFAPLNWRLTARELTYIAKDCLPRVILFGPEYGPVAEELAQALDGVTLVALEDGASEGVALARGALRYQDLLAQASSAEPERPSLNAEDPYCLLYTSGTTGRPKGAILPHRQILWNCINTVISWGLTAQDITPILTPMFHAGGLFVFLTPVFYAGGQVVLTRSFQAEQSLQIIEREKCTVILGVPTIFQVWLNSPYFPRADFSQVRFFISGGASCPVSLMEAWRRAKGVVFRQGYGLTEVGTNCFSMTDEESEHKSGSVGKPIFHSQMRLVDQQGCDVPAGQTGELLISGPHVCSGYWHNPEATAQAIQEGWFRTGDMAHMDEDGFYYIDGRYKDMLISGGENVYSAEVEAVFREHPAVAEAALIGQPDEKWGEVGLMVVVPKTGFTPSEQELLRFCKERLAGYKTPKRVVFLDALPYSPYGKVMKAELKKLFVK